MFVDPDKDLGAQDSFSRGEVNLYIRNTHTASCSQQQLGLQRSGLRTSNLEPKAVDAHLTPRVLG